MQPDLTRSLPRALPRFSPGSWAVLGVALIVLALGVALFWLRVTTPSDGARLKIEEWPWRPDGFVVTPIDEGLVGLRRGDLVVAVDRRSLESWAQALFVPGAPHPRWHIGQMIVYTVVRDGRIVDVPIALRRFPLGALLAQIWGTIADTVVFLLVGAFVFAKRPDARPART